MRKEKIITINDNGNALKFKIRQLTATKQEELIIKVLLLVANKDMGDVDVEEVRNNPERLLNGKTLMSIIDNLDYEKIKPISDTLLGCCCRVNGAMEEQCTPATVDAYVEDFRTLFLLKKEAIGINFGFFGEGGISQDTSLKETIKIG